MRCWLLLLLAGISAAQSRPVHLVIEDGLLARIGSRIPAGWSTMRLSQVDGARLVSALAGGDHLIWIGAPAALPADLWIGAFRPVEGPVALSVADSSPLPMQQVFHRAAARSAYLKPVKEMPYHNQDEELRADLEPLLEARDRFGQVVGYPAVLMRHYAPSFVRRRFDGGEHFFFLLDRPSEALDDQAWGDLLTTIAMRLKTGLELARTGADYASYRSGERVTARAGLRNVGPRMAAGTLRFLAKAPGEREFREVQQERRLPDAGGSSEAIASFVPHGPPGLWSLRVELLADPAHLTEPAVAGRPVLIDRRNTGFIVLDSELRGGPRISFDGPRIRIDGTGGFLTGTNYYPSSSWWEWLWRDFRPLAAVEDFASMRRTGYRIVRIWAEPELDETTLRAMDAAIYLAGRAGLVVDLCLFTQWVRTMAFENPNHDRIRFDFRGPRDFNIYGISLRNLEWQRGYAASLARRWRSAENLVFNLANETYVNDPDRSQMDPKALQWPGIPAAPGVLRDSLLFRAWAREIVAAIRETGAKQPVIPGYIFAEMKGGDAYLAQRDGEIAAWHSYSNFDHTAAALSYVDPHSSGRPMLLEEMGTTGWNRPEVYDALAHAALAAGAAGVMSYEWGVRWLAPEMSFAPVPLREVLESPPDPRWFQPLLGLTSKWSPLSPGFHPAPSGFFYGSIYSGTPFPAAAATALGRLGILGRELERGDAGLAVYLVIPTAQPSTMPAVTAAIQKLREQAVVFGIFQEDSLARLPHSTRILLCPTALRSETVRMLKQRGLEIRTDPATWSAGLPRLDLQPSGKVRGTVLPTSTGMLYTLQSSQGPEVITLNTGQQAISLGVSPYGLIHQTEAGVTLAETAGKLRIHGQEVAEISSGRILLASSDGLPLEKAPVLRLLVTEPAEVTFSRPIAAIRAFEPGGPSRGFPIEFSGGHRLHVDSELARYELHVEFGEQR